MRYKLLFIIIMILVLISCTSQTPDAQQPTDTILPSVTSTLIKTDTPESTATSIYTPITSPTEITFHFEVFAFHDQNGNEFRNENEPPIQGVKFSINGNSCISDVGGICGLGFFPPGRYHLDIDTNDADIHKLDFIFFEKEVVGQKFGMDLDIEEDTQISIPLSQGPITIPIINDSFGEFSLGFGDFTMINHEKKHHTGIDIEIIGEGPQPIFAPVSGILKPVPPNEDPPWGECNHVTIDYSGPSDDFMLGIGHLTEVIVNPDVPIEKGDIIGYIDPTLYPAPGWIACTSHPHIHLGLWGNVPGKSWPRESSSDFPWEPLPPNEWGWLDPELYLPLNGLPLPMFISQEEANIYSSSH